MAIYLNAVSCPKMTEFQAYICHLIEFWGCFLSQKPLTIMILKLIFYYGNKTHLILGFSG